MTKLIEKRLLTLIKSALDLGQIANEKIEYFNRKAILMTNILNKQEVFGLSIKLNSLKFRSLETFYFGWVQELFKTLKEKYTSKTINLQVFYDELNKYLDGIKRKALKEFLMVFPINIKFTEEMPKKLFNFQRDIQINIVDYRDFRTSYLADLIEYKNALNDYTEKSLKDLIENLDFYRCSYIVVKMKARDIYYVRQIAIKNIESNMGILNYLEYGQRRFIQFRVGVIGEEISNSYLPLVIVYENDKFDTVWYSSFKPFSNFYEYNREAVDIFNNLVEDIGKIGNVKLRYLIFDVFQTYFTAMTLKEKDDSFLKFWNIIEKLFFKSASVKDEKIVTRMKSMLNRKHPHIQDIFDFIDLIHYKRNQFVHEATNTINMWDRDFLRYITEIFIEIYLFYAQKLNDKGMLEFLYDNMNKHKKLLTKEIDTLKLIQKMKYSKS